MTAFGETLDTPVGPAAGPNTQLAQNIVAAYLSGSRFIELKTVQQMDGEALRACVPRPCINAADEGYNVEWSTELTVPEAFGEYVKAWLMLHVLCRELEISPRPRCVFNMSVGYDLAGIRGEKIDGYIEGMKNASGHPVYEDGIRWLKENRGRFKKVSDRDIAEIPARVSGSAALYLRRNGVDVTVLEKRKKPFGLVEYVIPAFRIPEEALRRDFAMAEKAGVRFVFGAEPNADVSELRRAYDFVILAVGAWGPGAPAVSEGQAHLRDALAFLEEAKEKDCRVTLGRRVAVIGGGDVAMGCARAVKRAPGVESVAVVYRRTRRFMPAEPEELTLARKDGVVLIELPKPVRFDGKALTCEIMALGDWDESGRRGVVGTGQTVSLAFDSVITATVARVDTPLFAAAGLAADSRGNPLLNEARESAVPGVYVVGDCKAGPATVAAAMADGKAAAMDILEKLGLPHDFIRVPVPLNQLALQTRKGTLIREKEGPADAERCLSCGRLCESCCDVCPNRANVRVAVDGLFTPAQILHLDGFCNECGNCASFCPWTGRPYQDKVTLFWRSEDFENSENRGFLPLGGGLYRLRLETGDVLECRPDDPRVPDGLARLIKTVEAEYAYCLAGEEA